MRTPAWRDEGHDPDYRFSLANERTFLAWLRTGLALLAGGVVLDQFGLGIEPAWLVTVVAVGLAVAAGVVMAFAYPRWRANEKAMRQDRPLPHSSLPILLTALLLVLAGLALVLMVVR